MADVFPIYLYQSYLAIAEGFVAVALLVPLSLLRRPSWQWLGKAMKMPRAVRYFCLALALAGAAFFVSAAIGDWISNGAHYVIHQGLPIASQPPYYIEVPGSGGKGATPSLLTDRPDVLAALALGTGAFIAFRMERGIWTALGHALVRFLAPLVLMFEVGLLVFAPYTMIDHVMDFASWHYGIYLVSNWLVLIVASFLILVGVQGRSVGGDNHALSRSGLSQVDTHFLKETKPMTYWLAARE